MTTFDAHRLLPEFSNDLQNLLRQHFLRDAHLWPMYRDPTLNGLIEGRRKAFLPPLERLNAYPHGAELLAQLRTVSDIPRQTDSVGGVHPLLQFAATLSKNWEDPASVENVVTTPSDPALMGSILGTVANANLVYSEYAGLAEDLEAAYTTVKRWLDYLRELYYCFELKPYSNSLPRSLKKESKL